MGIEGVAQPRAVQGLVYAVAIGLLGVLLIADNLGELRRRSG